ncbi:MAG: hypothetical protein ACLP29_01685 [Dissulfurispiraceae bacterium]
MNIEDKTKEQLINELQALHKHISRLDELESRHQHECAKLLDAVELYHSIFEASPN